MNITTTFRLTLALAAAVLVTACGGGGSSPTAPLSQAAPANPSNALLTSSSTGLSLSLTIVPGTPHVSTKTSVARKRPQYVSSSTQGLQVAITAGSTTTTSNFSIALGPNRNANCTTSDGGYSYVCRFAFPTVAATETISVIEVDQPPTGTVNPNTGIATGDFPAGTNVLARGVMPLTVAPGVITPVTISLDPVIAQFYDCGFILTSGSAQDDGQRIVVTGNLPASGTIEPEDNDADGQIPFSPVTAPSASPNAQPFVDVNASPKPIKATSTLSNFTVLALPGSSAAPVAPVSNAYAATALFPDTSYNGTYDYSLNVAFHYDGNATPSGTGGTLTLDNQLTATPPVFTGAGGTVPPANYDATLQYIIAPVFAVPASFSLFQAATATVTGYDPGTTTQMNPSPCVSSSNATLGTLTFLSITSPGTQSFRFTAGSNVGTCTFTLKDASYGNIPSNTVTVTILPVP